MLPRRARSLSLLVVAGGLALGLSGQAFAASAPVPGPAGAPVAAAMQPLLASKQCAAHGPSASDKAIAKALAGKIHTPRLDSPDAGQISCARAIVAEVKKDKLDKRAAVIAVTTAVAESGLHDYTQADNGTSLGLFQQQTSEGWGTAAQVENPAYATNAFLTVMRQFYPDNRWQKGDIGDICQAVQRSGDPGAYDPEVPAANPIVAKLW